MERRLSVHDQLCDDYWLADIATWICLAFAQSLGIRLGEHSGIQAWFERLHSRPAITSDCQQLMATATVACRETLGRGSSPGIATIAA